MLLLVLLAFSDFKPEEVGQGHVNKVLNRGVGQRKLTNLSIVMNRSCSQPDP